MRLYGQGLHTRQGIQADCGHHWVYLAANNAGKYTQSWTPVAGQRTGGCQFHACRSGRVRAQPPATTKAPPATTGTSCYPLSNEGTCYEPGEYCRKSDHGMTGVAGDGKRIVCEDNHGWRREPV